MARAASGPCAAVSGWKFRATAKNSCDAVVAEFFWALYEAATATRSTPKPGHMARSPRYLNVFELGDVEQVRDWPESIWAVFASFNITVHYYSNLARPQNEPSVAPYLTEH